jgi:hypothetical protein
MERKSQKFTILAHKMNEIFQKSIFWPISNHFRLTLRRFSFFRHKNFHQISKKKSPNEENAKNETTR